VKRWGPVLKTNEDGSKSAVMAETPYGGWVLYEDVRARQRDRLRELVPSVEWPSDGYGGVKHSLEAPECTDPECPLCNAQRRGCSE